MTQKKFELCVAEKEWFLSPKLTQNRLENLQDYANTGLNDGFNPKKNREFFGQFQVTDMPRSRSAPLSAQRRLLKLVDA